jgi:hypothetical protein
VGKQEGMEPQGRPRHRRVENIKMDHREKGWHFRDKITIILSQFKWTPHTGRRINKIIFSCCHHIAKPSQAS